MSGRHRTRKAVLGSLALLLGVLVLSSSGPLYAQTHTVLGEFGTTST